MKVDHTAEREAELLADIKVLTKNRDEAVAERNKFLAERDQLKAINAELLKTLSRILYAHENHGNGAAMGEALLCNHYADMARLAIAKATGSKS